MGSYLYYKPTDGENVQFPKVLLLKLSPLAANRRPRRPTNFKRQQRGWERIDNGRGSWETACLSAMSVVSFPLVLLGVGGHLCFRLTDDSTGQLADNPIHRCWAEEGKGKRKEKTGS